mgnify:FL=1|jgi:hypothetical protein
MAQSFSGGCVCGGVRYTANKLRPLWYCHCEQCRRMTGNFMAASQVDIADISVVGSPKWFYVSEKSRYGFCSECGSQLFWRNDDNDYLSVTGGSLDASKGLKVGGHIFTCEKAEYVKIPAEELTFLTYWSQPPE